MENLVAVALRIRIYSINSFLALEKEVVFKTKTYVLIDRSIEGQIFAIWLLRLCDLLALEIQNIIGLLNI